MSRVDRIRNEYSKPTRGPSGIASDPKNLRDWSKRASDNSELAPRAKGGAIDLPNTGGAPSMRSTASKPKGFGGDPYAKAKADMNSTGDSPYMKGVRRTVNGS
jgi:hypothetical protein